MSYCRCIMEQQEKTHLATKERNVSACGCDTDHHDGEWISTAYKGKIIYFCADSCKQEFLDDPESFLKSDHFLLDFEVLTDADE